MASVVTPYLPQGLVVDVYEQEASPPVCFFVREKNGKKKGEFWDDEDDNLFVYSFLGLESFRYFQLGMQSSTTISLRFHFWRIRTWLPFQQSFEQHQSYFDWTQELYRNNKWTRWVFKWWKKRRKRFYCGFWLTFFRRILFTFRRSFRRLHYYRHLPKLLRLQWFHYNCQERSSGWSRRCFFSSEDRSRTMESYFDLVRLLSVFPVMHLVREMLTFL